MANDLGRLMQILGAELSIYEELLAIARDKQEQVIHNRVDLLDQAVSRERQLVDQIEALEAERSVAMLGVTGRLRLDPKVATLSVIAEAASPDEGRELLALRDKIAATLGALKTQGDTNERLIRDSLRYINYSLGLVLPDSDEGDATYDSRNRQLTPEKKSRLFDVKA